MFYAEADDWQYTTDDNEILGAPAFSPRITSAYALFPFFLASQFWIACTLLQGAA
jgi:hypothetical protein